MIALAALGTVAMMTRPLGLSSHAEAYGTEQREARAKSGHPY